MGEFGADFGSDFDLAGAAVTLETVGGIRLKVLANSVASRIQATVTRLKVLTNSVAIRVE